METEPRHPIVAYDFFSQSDVRSSPSTNYSPYISSYYNEGTNIGLHSEEVQSHQHQLHFHHHHQHQQQQLQHHHRSSHQQHCYHNQTIPSASSVCRDSQLTDQQSRQCDVIQLHWTSSSTHHLSLSQNSGSQYGAQAATLNYDQDYMTTNIQSVNHNDNFVEQSHVLLASGNGREDNTLANCGEGSYHQHLYTGMTTTFSDGGQYSYGYYDHPFQSNHYQAPITGDRNLQEELIKDDGYQYHQAPKLQTTSSLQELVSRKSENTSGAENVGAKTWQSAPINQSDNINQVETCQQSSSDLFIAQLHNNKDESSSFKDAPSWPSAGGVALAPTATTYSPSGLQITNHEPPTWHPSRIQPIKEQESAPVSRPNNSFGRTASDVLKTTGSSKNLTSRPAAAAVAAASSDGQTLVNLVAMRRRNQCHVCGRNYARPSTLKTHLRTHTNERPFKCNVCLKTFSQAANLTAHQRVHTGERPFSCPICGRQFSQSSSVITHLRTHSGERPYRCINCERTFSDSSTLTKHCRIHSGEKPYQCEYCPLNFSQSGNLSRHLKLHLISSSANVGGGTTSTPVGSASTSLTTSCNIMTPLSTSNRSSSSHSAFSLSSLSSSSSSISSSNEAAPAISDQCYITSQKVQ